MSSPKRPQVRSKSKTLHSMLSLQTNLFRTDPNHPRGYNQSAQRTAESLTKRKTSFIKVRASLGGVDSTPEPAPDKQSLCLSTCKLTVPQQRDPETRQLGHGSSAKEIRVSFNCSVGRVAEPHLEVFQGSKERGSRPDFLVRKGSSSPTKKPSSNSRPNDQNSKADGRKAVDEFINSIHSLQSINRNTHPNNGFQGQLLRQEFASKRPKPQIKMKLETRASQTSNGLPVLSSDSSPTNIRIKRGNSSCSISLHSQAEPPRRYSISDADTQSISPKRLECHVLEQDSSPRENSSGGASKHPEEATPARKLPREQNRSLAEISLGNLNQNPHIQQNNDRVKDYLRELDGIKSQTRQLIQHSYLELTDVIRKHKEHSPARSRVKAALTQPTVGRRTKLLAFLVKKVYYKALGWKLLGKGPIHDPIIPSAVCSSPAGLLFLKTCKTGESLKALAVLKSDKRLIFEYNHLQQTAYHICAKRDYCELLVLISSICKGDIDGKDITGRTALRWAYESRSLQCLKTLLALGASPFGCRKRTDDLVAKEQFEANMILDEAIMRHVYIKYLGPYKKRLAFYSDLTPLPHYL